MADSNTVYVPLAHPGTLRRVLLVVQSFGGRPKQFLPLDKRLVLPVDFPTFQVAQEFTAICTGSICINDPLSCPTLNLQQLFKNCDVPQPQPQRAAAAASAALNLTPTPASTARQPPFAGASTPHVTVPVQPATPTRSSISQGHSPLQAQSTANEKPHDPDRERIKAQMREKQRQKEEKERQEQKVDQPWLTQNQRGRFRSGSMREHDQQAAAPPSDVPQSGPAFNTRSHAKAQDVAKAAARDATAGDAAMARQMERQVQGELPERAKPVPLKKEKRVFSITMPEEKNASYYDAHFVSTITMETGRKIELCIKRDLFESDCDVVVISTGPTFTTGTTLTQAGLKWRHLRDRLNGAKVSQTYPAYKLVQTPQGPLVMAIHIPEATDVGIGYDVILDIANAKQYSSIAMPLFRGIGDDAKKKTFRAFLDSVENFVMTHSFSSIAVLEACVYLPSPTLWAQMYDMLTDRALAHCDSVEDQLARVPKQQPQQAQPPHKAFGPRQVNATYGYNPSGFGQSPDVSVTFVSGQVTRDDPNTVLVTNATQEALDPKSWLTEGNCTFAVSNNVLCIQSQSYFIDNVQFVYGQVLRRACKLATSLSCRRILIVPLGSRAKDFGTCPKALPEEIKMFLKALAQTRYDVSGMDVEFHIKNTPMAQIAEEVRKLPGWKPLDLAV
eukprot:m.326940 g.326940  ORF g.326940 m.326940 type:complete len:671 (-) comp16022_c1_seq24:6176-8188(-)